MLRRLRHLLLISAFAVAFEARVFGASSAEAARKELAGLGLQYTAEAFLKSIDEGDKLAVDLFLTAGMDPNMDGDNATDQAAAQFDDIEVKCLLLGGENERQKAGDALFQGFAVRLMGKLRHFTLLSDDEKASIIHDTILEVLKKAESADLDFDKPLIGLLLCICECKAIDLARWKSRQAGRDDELTDEIGEALADTSVGVAWKNAISNEDAPAIRDEFLTFISTLPTQQKFVAGVLADNLGFKLSYEEISQKIFQSTGKTVSKIAIKGALSVIRQKFKMILKQKFPDLFNLL